MMAFCCVHWERSIEPYVIQDGCSLLIIGWASGRSLLVSTFCWMRFNRGMIKSRATLDTDHEEDVYLNRWFPLYCVFQKQLIEHWVLQMCLFLLELRWYCNQTSVLEEKRQQVERSFVPIGNYDHWRARVAWGQAFARICLVRCACSTTPICKTNLCYPAQAIQAITILYQTHFCCTT